MVWRVMIVILMFKKFIQSRLEKRIKQYFINHPETKLIVVAGSVGKTGTKLALGTLLSERYSVRMHEGNYNSEIGTPMAILGLEVPDNTKSILGWWRVLRAAKHRAHKPDDVEVIIQELGVDRPGNMQKFAKYLKPDFAMVSAVTPEHMEFFGTIEAVAQEEMSVANFSDFVLINRDDVDGRFAQMETNPNFTTYGTSALAEYSLIPARNDGDMRLSATMNAPELAEPFTVSTNMVGEHSLRPIAGAIGVALKLGLTPEQIVSGVGKIQPAHGRMQPLRGIDGTVILDDTYNSSPAAALAALTTLYEFQDAPQRIAVLGSMNELGETSQTEHEKLGSLCNPDLLAWVVVVGEEAAKYLAPAAKLRGCQVKVCANAIEAGAFVRSITEEGAVILLKGSQGGIYLEEAVKMLCAMSEDHRLVRQSESWMKIKNDHFSKFPDQA